jgi:hypothetical protein
MKPTTNPSEVLSSLIAKHLAIQPQEDAAIASRVAAEMIGDVTLTRWALEAFVMERLNRIERDHRRDAIVAARDGMTAAPREIARRRQEAILRGQMEATRGRVAERAKILREYGPYLMMAFDGAPLYGMTRDQVLDIASRRETVGRTYQQQAGYLRDIAIRLGSDQTVADAWTEADLARLYVRKFQGGEAPLLQAAE